MPLQATSGAASYDAFGGGVAAVPTYIEDIFSTTLYTGNGSTQTITNGIDLAGKGGLTWFKARDVAASHLLFDSARGVTKYLISNLTNAEATSGAGERLTAYNSNGFSLGTDPGSAINASSNTYASWTFRKQPKFFDVVTYTGNGAGQGARAVPHNLQSSPGCIIIKATSATSQWAVWHRYAGVFNEDISGLSLNSTGAATGYPNATSALMNSTSFDPANIYGTDFVTCNANGVQYVAYLFAHNAGGFGLSGTDNVISCGSYVGAATDVSVSLGYEPQWLMVKNATNASSWLMMDTMRGMPVGADGNTLAANSSAAENGVFGADNILNPTATGFIAKSGKTASNENGSTHIYIAIRRGPMKVPTDGTSVFAPIARSGTGGATTISSSNRPDAVIENWRSGAYGSADHYVVDRLRGVQRTIFTNLTAAEATQTTNISALNNVSYQFSGDGLNASGGTFVDYSFTRAPGFFDEVCYTGDGAASRNITHSLTVTPELIFAKSRSNTANWVAYNAFGNGLILNSTAAANSGFNFITSATASTFTPADPASFGGSPNQSGQTYVAYLFASCPGVSKVGSYTGTGTTQVINCGFTAGSRFVMIKRTDSTGDWYVWDSARGIVAGNDPYLLLNSTAAEVTSTDYVDTAATGFELSSTAPAAINASGGSYIFLAIA